MTCGRKVSPSAERPHARVTCIGRGAAGCWTWCLTLPGALEDRRAYPSLARWWRGFEGELASHSGSSQAHQPRIERGLVSASGRTRDRVARGLGIPPRTSSSTVTFTRASVAAGQGLSMDCMNAIRGYRYELLRHVRPGHLHVEPCIVRLGPDAAPPPRYNMTASNSSARAMAACAIGTGAA